MVFWIIFYYVKRDRPTDWFCQSQSIQNTAFWLAIPKILYLRTVE